MTDLSARFSLPLLQSGQAQKELFHNEALTLIDAALHPSAPTIATNDPPPSAVVGKAWIVGAAGTGAWIGHMGHIATSTSGGWRFTTPVAGMVAWITDVGQWAWHDGTAWRLEPFPTSGVSVHGKQVVGSRAAPIPSPAGGATIDAEGRGAIGAILAALRTHGLIGT